MRKFTLFEISGVNVPAQTGARVTIMKRADPVDKSSLVQLVTGSSKGHQHGLSVNRYGDGEINVYLHYAQTADSESSHDHGLMIVDGAYTVLENAGHTHTIDSTALATAIVGAVQKQKEEADMTPEQIAAMKARNERLEKMLLLKGAARLYFDTLAGELAQDAFLAKAADVQVTEVTAWETTETTKAAAKTAADAAKAAETDPVVHTTKAGIEIRKSDGITALALAKHADAQDDKIDGLVTENVALKSAGANALFEKRAAEELKFLPGSLKSRAALLKAAEGIEDETERTEAVAALKTQNKRFEPLFVTKGVNSAGEIVDIAGDGDEGPQSKLEELAKAHQVANPTLTYEQAEAAVLSTPAGVDLYSEIAKQDSDRALAA